MWHFRFLQTWWKANPKPRSNGNMTGGIRPSGGAWTSQRSFPPGNQTTDAQFKQGVWYMTSPWATHCATLHHCALWERMLCWRGTVIIPITWQHAALRHKCKWTNEGCVNVLVLFRAFTFKYQYKWHFKILLSLSLTKWCSQTDVKVNNQYINTQFDRKSESKLNCWICLQTCKKMLNILG